MKQIQPKVKKEKSKEKKATGTNIFCTTPKNLEEQEQLFFESNCSCNPQFEYENPELATKFLSFYPEPATELMEIATKILDSFLQEFGSETAYLEAEGELIGQEETEQIFQQYIDEMDFTEHLSINFQSRQVAPTSVTYDPKSGKNKVNIRLPCKYRRGGIMGVIDHEIGTHFLRRYNERLQIWAKKREKHEVRNCIRSEEGFACTN